MASSDSIHEPCPRCGRPVEKANLSGLCPHCVMARLFEDDTPPTEPLLPTAEASSGVRFGDYCLHEEIAQGGMGTVFRAVHSQLKRVVALKIISGANYQSEKAKQRFQTEAEVVATLDHPNIVPVYDVGTVEGRPFYTMKLVHGNDLGRALKQNKLQEDQIPEGDSTSSPDSAHFSPPHDNKPGAKIACLIATVARAVHHAHLRGVLHRDLKPSNILLDSDGTPYVADFGLAKRLDTVSDLTVTGNILGTPAYMAPEQASGKVQEMTTAVDVYSLGALLYHCLTGHPPFSGESALEIIQQSATELPLPLSSGKHSWSEDLETICFKCLNKHPSGRYASALELAEDLDRWRQGEAITARPSSLSEKVWSWARRHPASASAIGVAVVSLLAFVGLIFKNDREQRALTSIAEKRAEDQTRLRKKSEAIQRQLDHSLFRHRIQKAESYFDQLAGTEGLAYLAYLLRQNPEKRELGTRLIGALSHRQLSRPSGSLGTSTDELIALRHDPQGKRLAAATENNQIRLWNWDSREAINQPIDAAGELVAFDFNRSGDRLVTVAMNVTNKNSLTSDSTNEDSVTNMSQSANDSMWLHCRVWDTETGDQLFDSPRYRYPTQDLVGMLNLIELAQSTDWSRSLALFNPSGEQLALGFGAAQGFLNWREPVPQADSVLRPTEVAIVASDWSVDGRYYAQTQRWGPLIVWDLEKGVSQDYTTIRPPERYRTITFHPTENIFATSTTTHYVYIWSVNETKPIHMLRHPDDVRGIAWHPGGTELATTCLDGRVRTWDTKNFEIQDQFIQVNRPLSTIQYSSSGQQIFIVDNNGIGSIWELESGDLIVEKIKSGPHFGITHNLSQTANLVNGSKIQLSAFNPQPHLRAARLQHEYSGITRVGFSHDGNRLFTATRGQSFRIRDGRTGAPVDGERLPHKTLVGIAFSPSGKEFTAVGGLAFRVKRLKSHDMTGEVWEHQHIPRNPSPVVAAGWVAKGQSYFLLKLNRQLVFFESDNYHTELGSITLDFEPLNATANRTGDYLLIYGESGQCVVVDTRKRSIVRSRNFNDRTIRKAVFSIDSRMIFLNDEGGMLSSWLWQHPSDLETPLLTLEDVESFDVCPVSDRLVTSSKNGETTVHTLNETTTGPIKLMGQTIQSARFSPDGRYILTINRDKTARLWDPSSGLQVWEALRHRAAITDAALSPDNKHLLVGTTSDAFLWELPLDSLPNEIPSWLPSLAEAMAGIRFTSHNSSESLSELEVKRILAALPKDKDSFYSAWAHRLLNGDTPFESNPTN